MYFYPCVLCFDYISKACFSESSLTDTSAGAGSFLYDSKAVTRYHGSFESPLFCVCVWGGGMYGSGVRCKSACSNSVNQ